MAAGQPVLQSDLYTAIFDTLSGDSLIQEYAPGGCCAVHPAQGAAGPFVRYWLVSAKDDIRQDGQLGRCLTEFKFIIAMLDTSQKGGEVNYIDSPLLAGAIANGARRIYNLLHDLQVTVNGFDFTFCAEGSYEMTESSGGDLDVMVGWRMCAYAV